MRKILIGALVKAASVAIPLLMLPAVTQAAGKVDAKQWVIGANGSGFLYPGSAANSFRRSIITYNIKGTVLRKFLQYEKQGKWKGINLGWTNNASAKTAKKRAKNIQSTGKLKQYKFVESFCGAGGIAWLIQ